MDVKCWVLQSLGNNQDKTVLIAYIVKQHRMDDPESDLQGYRTSAVWNLCLNLTIGLVVVAWRSGRALVSTAWLVSGWVTVFRPSNPLRKFTSQPERPAGEIVTSDGAILKMQSETADFDRGAATWRTGRNIYASIVFNSGQFAPLGLCENTTSSQKTGST